ncbi:superoxide dismutase family protein [Archangium sp.]|uniref:superoxide dismutase family protein n=1 Tax=Archangium sp. TaxID=1872627 RepID=UPI00389A5717
MKTRALLTAAVLCLAGPALAQGKSPAAKEKAATKKDETAAKKDEKTAEMANAAGGATATANVMDAKGASLGQVTLTETPHGILVKGSLANLPPGEHAIHIHETGKCEAPFKTAGGHLNPDKKKHGILASEGQHEGDLPNLYVGADGKAQFDFFAHGLKLKDLQDADGAAVVVHATADDYKTDPAGNAGDRIACGLVQAQK